MQYWGPGRVVVGVHMPRDKRPGSHSSRCPCERGACAIKMPRTKGYARKKNIAQQAHGRRPRGAPFGSCSRAEGRAGRCYASHAHRSR